MPEPRFRVNKYCLVILFMLLAALADQLVKFLIRSYMHEGQSVPVINGIFHLTFVTNTGSSFGMLLGWNTILIFISFAAIGFVIYNLKNIKQSEKALLVFAGLLLGGITGNLIDRIFLGHVIDFIELGYKPVYTWPVFNLADSVLSISATFLAIYLWKRK